MHDNDLKALFADDSAAPADFGFTTKVMAHVGERQQLRTVVMGAGLLVAAAISAPLLISGLGDGINLSQNLNALLPQILTLGAAALAMGGLGYAMQQAE